MLVIFKSRNVLYIYCTYAKCLDYGINTDFLITESKQIVDNSSEPTKCSLPLYNLLCRPIKTYFVHLYSCRCLKRYSFFIEMQYKKMKIVHTEFQETLPQNSHHLFIIFLCNLILMRLKVPVMSSFSHSEIKIDTVRLWLFRCKEPPVSPKMESNSVGEGIG